MATKRSKSRKKPKKKYLVEMTSFSVFIWGFCMIFLLAWIFVLGILVGRGFIPGGETAIFELKAQIAKLQEIVGNNRAVDKRSQKKSDKNPKLAFYERLSSKKVDAKSRWQPGKDVEVPQKEGAFDTRKAPPPNRLEGRNAHQEIKPKPKSMGKAPTTPKANEKKGSSQSLQILTETSIPEIRYTVQLASLGSRDKAERLINDLVDRGYPAYYYEAVVKGQTYFRVRCGEFTTNREAGRFAEKLTKDMGIKGFVSRFEKKLP